MADAIEARVLIAARDSLAQITPAAGYVTRPRVEMGAGIQPPTPLIGPALYVHDAEGSKAERIIHQPPTWEHMVRFAVNCWTRGTGEDGRVRELENLKSDVRRRLLRQDRTLEGLVPAGLIEVDVDDTDEETAKPAGAARIDFLARVRLTE